MPTIMLEICLLWSFCSQKQLNRVDSDATVHSTGSAPEGIVLVVFRQPMALDRFTAHDVTAAEPLG